MPGPPVETIVIDDDDDDDSEDNELLHVEPNAAAGDHGEADFQTQLELAIALSMQEAGRSHEARSTNNNGQPRTTTSVTDSRATAAQSRSDMERERLERQRRRQLEDEPSTSSSVRPEKRARVATIGDLNQADQQSSSSSSSFTPSSFNIGAAKSSSGMPRRFWDGRIMRVHNQMVPTSDSLTFPQVIDKSSQLESAIVGAYVLDPTWVVSHFDDATRLLLIMPGSPPQPGQPVPKGYDWTQARYSQVLETVKPNTFCSNPRTIVFGPQRESLMHTKIIALFYRDFCRICIPTANAVPYDWDTIDNSMYIHDFPLLKSNVDHDKMTPRTNPTGTQFTKKLLDVLQSLYVPNNFVSPFRKYDFSTSAQVRLIASTSGNWTGWDEMKRGGGHPAMATILKDLGFSKGGSWSFEAQGSSIGMYTDNWLAQMCQSLAGRHPNEYYSKKTPLPAGVDKKRWPLKVVYPTMNEVEASWGGTGHGGTIFCTTKHWARAKNLNLFYKCVSKRSRVTMHTKTVLGLHKNAETDTYEGYVYVGSHNFTSAAWGALQTSSSTNQPQLFMKNHEMGVIVPFRAINEQDLERQASESVTYKRPLAPYGPNDEPWMQSKADAE
ncbi:hypothetical protein OIO90_005327 [Microbotryomycetes sp. JL221]|nr:hypothetical protein OIO90_005327 [Microbotryomycetes sp. JL221]